MFILVGLIVTSQKHRPIPPIFNRLLNGLLSLLLILDLRQPRFLHRLLDFLLSWLGFCPQNTLHLRPHLQNRKKGYDTKNDNFYNYPFLSFFTLGILLSVCLLLSFPCFNFFSALLLKLLHRSRALWLLNLQIDGTGCVIVSFKGLDFRICLIDIISLEHSLLGFAEVGAFWLCFCGLRLFPEKFFLEFSLHLFKLLSCNHGSDFWLKGILFMEIFRRHLLLAIQVFLHTAWHLRFSIWDFGHLIHTFLPCDQLLFNLLVIDQHWAGLRDRICFKLFPLALLIQPEQWGLCLSSLHHLFLITLPKRKWCFPLLRYLNAVFFNFLSSLLIRCNYALVLGLEHIGWNGFWSKILI